MFQLLRKIKLLKTASPILSHEGKPIGSVQDKKPAIQPEVSDKTLQRQAAETHLAKMRSTVLYYYLGNNSTMTFHRKDCLKLEEAEKSNLIGLSQHPKSSWKACPECKPARKRKPKKKKSKKNTANVPATTAALWSAWELKLSNIATTHDITKAELLGKQLKILCEERGIFAEIKDNTIHMTTFSGEWYFDFVERPLKLFHRNYIGEDGFHDQEKSFPTPIQIIAYVQKHDMVYLKRQLLGSTEHRLAKVCKNRQLPLYTNYYLM